MELNHKHIRGLLSTVVTRTLQKLQQPVFWLYFFLLIVISATGKITYQILKGQIVKEKSIEISSLAELKVRQIFDFRERILQDALQFHGNQTFIEIVKRYIHDSDLKSESEIKDWITPIFKNLNYNDIVIINPQTKKNIFAFRRGHLELSAGDDLNCLDSDSIRFGDFTLNEDKDSVRLSILVPLILKKVSSSEKVAVLKFILDPRQKLYDLMQSMPNSGRTGEILVVEKDGDDILFLNELRFKKNSALKLRLPITTNDLPAAKALLGDEGVSEGIDYRGIRVLAIARLIPGTGWSVVVKFDINEIYSELKVLGILIFGMVLILIMASGSGLTAILARKKLKYYKLRVNYLSTIQRLNHVYKLLTDIEQAIVKHNTTGALLDEVCRIIANEGSYALCWIGILNDQTGYLELIKHCKGEKKYSLTIQAGLSQIFIGSQDPATMAILEGKYFVSENLQTDFSIQELKDKAIPEEFRSMAVFPLQQCSETIGALYFYANENDFFTKEELKLLERLSVDLSYALDKIKQEVILKKSEQRFRSFVSASSEALFRMSPDWSILLELNSRDFLAKSIKLNPNWLNEYIHPDDQLFITSSIREAIRTKSIFTLEHRVLKADCSWGWTLSRAVPLLDENNEIIEWFGTALDITSRKEAEEALRESQEKFSTAFRSNPNALVISNKNDGTIIEVNETFLTLFERTKDEVVGKTSSQLGMFTNPADREEFTGILTLDGHIFNHELKIRRRRSGEERTVNISIVPLNINGNEAMITTLQDITCRKQMEESLKIERNRLRDLHATKDKLFSILTHDLKGPFTSILGFSELLIENVRNNDLNDIANYATLIRDSSENAMNLLTNLINWSRLQTGKISFNPTFINLNSIVSETSDLLFGYARQKSILLVSDIPSYLKIFADELMINTILRNLVSNAIKFSYQGSKVTITALRQESAVIITVNDKGTGMNEEVIEKLFEHGENFSTPGTQNEMGTGLGLLICKEFISKHGGEIWVESEPGKGSSFTFSVPH